jgi:hypothetical protein
LGRGNFEWKVESGLWRAERRPRRAGEPKKGIFKQYDWKRGFINKNHLTELRKYI